MHLGVGVDAVLAEELAAGPDALGLRLGELREGDDSIIRMSRPRCDIGFRSIFPGGSPQPGTT